MLEVSKDFERLESKSLKSKCEPAALVISDKKIGLVRSLGEVGIPVVIGGTMKDAANASRYVHDKIVFPRFDTPAFIEQLVSVGPQFKEKPVLFTTDDKVLLSVSRHREILSNYYRFLLPGKELAEDLADKRRFAKLAEKHGLPVPQTFLPRNMEELQQVSKIIEYPCILKPAHNELWKDPQMVHGLLEGHFKKAIKVHSAADLISTYEWVQTFSPEMVVQEYVEGRDENLYSLNVYINRSGQVQGVFLGHKIRTYPAEFGIGSCVESFVDQELMDLGIKVLKDLGYCGVANVGFKRDSRSHQPKILEINLRFNLWTYLGTYCGINLPARMYYDLIDQPSDSVNHQSTYPTGVRWIRLKTDLMAYKEYRKKGHWSPWTWLQSYAHKRVFHTFSAKDPAPALYDLLISAQRKFKRIFNKS
jgi:D-aspartate ligase